MQDFAVEVITLVSKWEDAADIFDVCTYIKNSFDKKYGGFWCCIVGKRGHYGGTSVKHQKGYYISMVNAQFTFLIYMSPQKNFK